MSKNLNTIGIDLTCKREIGPAIKNFSQPQWQELDIWEHHELIKHVLKFLELGDQNASSPSIYDDPKEFNLYLKNSAKFGWDTLHLATVDIDNDGKTEHVMRYEAGHCLGTKRFGTPL